MALEERTMSEADNNARGQSKGQSGKAQAHSPETPAPLFYKAARGRTLTHGPHLTAHHQRPTTHESRLSTQVTQNNTNNSNNSNNNSKY